MRRPLVAANWKMHLRRAEAAAFCACLREGLEKNPSAAELVVFPAAPLLDTVAKGLFGSGVALGGQDVHREKDGAFTGDVSAMHLHDAGCTWALCGHSERRQGHGESSRHVGEKMKAAENAGLRALLCVGELEAERRAARTEEVLAHQLEAALAAGAEPIRPRLRAGVGDRHRGHRVARPGAGGPCLPARRARPAARPRGGGGHPDPLRRLGQAGQRGRALRTK